MSERVTVTRIMPVHYTMRGIAPGELPFLGRQSGQLEGQTQMVGSWEGKKIEDPLIDPDPTWHEGWSNKLRTPEYCNAEEGMIMGLGETCFQSLSEMKEFCSRHPEAKIDDQLYGFRITTDAYSFLVKCDLDPKAEVTLGIYAYSTKFLDHQIQEAQRGIRFRDGDMQDMFTLKDGSEIRLKFKDGSDQIEPCRYIDPTHVQVGLGLYHINEFAGICANNGVKIEPVRKADVILQPLKGRTR